MVLVLQLVIFKIVQLGRVSMLHRLVEKFVIVVDVPMASRTMRLGNTLVLSCWVSRLLEFVTAFCVLYNIVVLVC